MPFSRDAFLEVFAAYNQALWPVAVVLWLLTAAVVARLMTGRRLWPALPRLVLAGHWLWAGVFYHALFFTAISPAGWLFAALFLVQAGLLVSASTLDRARLNIRTPRGALSAVLMIYGLAYPAVAWADGFTYPYMPTFGVPCPTAVLTMGFLLFTSAASATLSLVPIVWSLIAATAAWSFGVHADLVLPVSAALLAGDLILKRSSVMKKMLVAGCLALAMGMPAIAVAQTPGHDHEKHVQTPAQGKTGQMKMGEMKMDAKMMEEMAAKKKANSARIAALMAKVRTATGDAKATAMADVIAVLIEERAEMEQHCATMMKH
jgi:hypothetical protein